MGSIIVLCDPFQTLKNSEYLKNKYVQFDDKTREDLLKTVKTGKVKFDRIEYFENKYSFKIVQEKFIKLTQLMDKFDSNDSVDKYYKFTKKVVQNNNVNVDHIFVSFEPYQILRESDYLQSKYAQFSDINKKLLLQISKSDISLFETIKTYEEKYQIEIPTDDFIELAKLLNKFENFEEMDTFYDFSKKVSDGKEPRAKLLHELYDPFQAMKESEYLKNKYIQFDEKARDALLKTAKEGKVKFDRIEYFEGTYTIQVPLDKFIIASHLLSRFSTNKSLNSFIEKNYKNHFNQLNIDDFLDYLAGDSYSRIVMISYDYYLKHKILFYLGIFGIILLMLYLVRGYRINHIVQNKRKKKLLPIADISDEEETGEQDDKINTNNKELK